MNATQPSAATPVPPLPPEHEAEVLRAQNETAEDAPDDEASEDDVPDDDDAPDDETH